MQYNYDFHFHQQLVNTSQMLIEFESFFYNMNVHNRSWYGKPNFLPAQLSNSRKRVFDCYQEK